MKIIEATVCHKFDDTRIYHKYVKSLLAESICVGYLAPFPLVEVDSGLTVFPIKRSNYVFVRLFGFIKKIPDMIRFSPDYIHIHDPELLLLVPLLKLFGFRLIYDMHENFPKEIDDKPIGQFNKIIQKFFWHLINKFILTRLPIVFAEASYLKYYSSSEKKAVVQNFPSEKNLSSKRVPSELPHDKPRFVYLGTISEDRGAIKMYEALENAFGSNGYELHYIGDIFDTNLAIHLHKLFSRNPNIIFHGYKSMYDAWQICRDCDVGLAILDSKENYIESYPTKLFEYFLCGIPVVTSNFDLYSDLISKYTLGLCVDPDDLNDISHKFKNIVRDDTYFHLSNGLKDFPFQDFVWECEFSKFLNMVR